MFQSKKITRKLMASLVTIFIPWKATPKNLPIPSIRRVGEPSPALLVFPALKGLGTG